MENTHSISQKDEEEFHCKNKILNHFGQNNFKYLKNFEGFQKTIKQYLLQSHHPEIQENLHLVEFALNSAYYIIRMKNDLSENEVLNHKYFGDYKSFWEFTMLEFFFYLDDINESNNQLLNENVLKIDEFQKYFVKLRNEFGKTDFIHYSNADEEIENILNREAVFYEHIYKIYKNYEKSFSDASKRILNSKDLTVQNYYNEVRGEFKVTCKAYDQQINYTHPPIFREILNISCLHKEQNRVEADCLEILKVLAGSKKLEFRSIPSAIFHWRKFVLYNLIQDEITLEISWFIEKANYIVENNEHIISGYDFEFKEKKKDRNNNDCKLNLFVTISSLSKNLSEPPHKIIRMSFPK